MIDLKGHRCYNGCLDKEAQAIVDESRRQDAILKHFGARACHYPMEGKWMVWKDLDAVTGFHNSKSEAYFYAIRKIGGSSANIPTLS